MSKRARIRKEARQRMNTELAKLPNDTLVEVPSYRWPAQAHSNARFKVLQNRRFLVQLFREPNDVIRLSVTKAQLGAGKRLFADGISWDELQVLKSMAGYGDRMAVEIYPTERDVINVANMRHIWVLPKPLNIGWSYRCGSSLSHG